MLVTYPVKNSGSRGLGERRAGQTSGTRTANGARNEIGGEQVVRAYSRRRVECRETTVDGAHDTLGGVPRSRRAQPRPRPCVTHPARSTAVWAASGEYGGNSDYPSTRPPLSVTPFPERRPVAGIPLCRRLTLPAEKRIRPPAHGVPPPVPGVLLFVRRRRSGRTCERRNRKNPPSTPKIVLRT